MIRRLHPSHFGFWGGLGLGFLLALFAFGDVARLLLLVVPPAEAQFAPVFRIMDGAHTQLATVDHSGRLLVSTGSTSGLTDHITSVTHIQVSGSGTPTSSISVRCVNTGGTAFADCGGSGGGDTVNVFHQSTIRHISSVTHIAGTASIVDRAGNYVTVTAGELNVACSGCAAASVVAVSHISGSVHVVNSFGRALHIQGLGVPGASHGGVLTIQGITGMNAVTVAQSTANWTIAHIGGAVHLAGGVTDNANSALRVTGVTVFTVMGAIDHISSVVHVSSYRPLHIQGIGTPGAAHGGVVSMQGVGGGVPLNVENVRHVSSTVHVAGRIILSNVVGTAVTVTGTALDVNCTGCAAATVVEVDHISSVVHVVTAAGAALHIQGLGVPGASHGGVLTIQGIAGANAVSVAQSVANWNINHVSAAIHLAGGVTDNANSALRVTGVTVFTVMGAIDHISSVTHVRGGVFLTNQAGAAVTTTSNALDVNCTGCSSSATVHISAAVHVAGTLSGARFHVQGVGTPGQSHGGVLTVQGVTGMNALSVSQSTSRWNVDHVTSATHVVGRVSLTNAVGTAVTVTGTALDVNCTGCSSATVVEVDHISSVVHVVGSAGAALHIQGLGVPGASHGGVLTIQGITGMNPVTVAQSTANWTIAHISSSLHIARGVVLGNASNSTLVTMTGSALDVSVGNTVNTLVTNSTLSVVSGTAGGVLVQVSHIDSVVHVAGYGVFHIQGRGVAGNSHGGVLTIQGVAGMNAVAVSQSGGWSADQSGSWTVQAAHQGGEWNVRHVSAVVHVNLMASNHLTGALHVAGVSNIGSGAPGTYTTQMVCHSTIAIHVAAAAPGLTQIIHLTSSNGNVDQTSWRIYICGIMIVSAHAQGFSLYEGTGTTCVTGKRPLIGSYRPDESVVLAASGGFSAIAPFPWMSTQMPGNNLCIGQTTRTTGGTISGVMSYRAGP